MSGIMNRCPTAPDTTGSKACDILSSSTCAQEPAVASSPSPSNAHQRPSSRAQTPSWRSLPAKFKLTSNRRLTPQQQAYTKGALQSKDLSSWCLSRGRIPPVPPLHPAVKTLIADWFEAVDEDGSRTLEHHELMSALKAAHIPCDDQTINEMIELMDLNGDGVIGWDEFLNFMACEFHNGKSLTTGEWMMPSGTALNFGIMIGKLKRDKLMKEILESEGMRHRWVTVASDPVQLAKEMAGLTEAAQVAADMNSTLEAEMKAACDHLHRRGWTGTQQGLAAERLLHSLEAESRLSRPSSHQQALPPHYHQRGMADVLTGGSSRDSSTGSTLGLPTSYTKSDARSDARASTSRLGLFPSSVGDSTRKTSFDGFRSSSPIMGSSSTSRAASRPTTHLDTRSAMDRHGPAPAHHMVSSVFRIVSDTGNGTGTPPLHPGLRDAKHANWDRHKAHQGGLSSRSSLPLPAHSSTAHSTQSITKANFLQVGAPAFAGLRVSSDAGSARSCHTPPLLHRAQHDAPSNATRAGVSAPLPVLRRRSTGIGSRVQGL